MSVIVPCAELYPQVSGLSIPSGHLLIGIEQAIIQGMDKYEIRRQKVIELIKNQCDGVYAKFADRIDRSPSYVGRMLYPAGKLGKKNISDTLIDVIEEKFNLPRGWLDEAGRKEADSVPIITSEQQKFLSLLDSIDNDARAAFLKIGIILAEISKGNRRKNNIGHSPERRTVGGFPNFPQRPNLDISKKRNAK